MLVLIGIQLKLCSPNYKQQYNLEENNMPRPLEAIRADIDALDQKIVTSLFEEDIDEANPESADITTEEIAQIRALQLRFSAKTWSLINQRMGISKEVAESKK